MELNLIDLNIIGDVEELWEEELCQLEAVHPARCRGALARAKDIALKTNNSSNHYAYAVISKQKYLAIVFLSHVCPNSNNPRLKMLELTLCPSYANESSPCELEELIEIGAFVLSDVYALSEETHKSDQIKIYGDSLMDARVWKSIAHKIDDSSMPFEVSSHGKWLVLNNCN